MNKGQTVYLPTFEYFVSSIEYKVKKLPERIHTSVEFSFLIVEKGSVQHYKQFTCLHPSQNLKRVTSELNKTNSNTGISDKLKPNISVS